MSDARSSASAADRVGAGAGRLIRAWRITPHERRLAAIASLGLFLTLFLPWYQETVLVASGTKHPVAVSASVTGWGAFSFVEAAVLLVAAGVLVLLFERAEGKAFHVPGGDGGVITAAGVWTCLLVIWRIFDKQSTSIRGPGADISGIEWGIFGALAVAAFLAYAGTRIRAAHRPEPPLPGEQPAPQLGRSAPSGHSRREPSASARESERDPTVPLVRSRRWESERDPSASARESDLDPSPPARERDLDPSAPARESDRDPSASARESDRDPRAPARESDRDPSAPARESDRDPTVPRVADRRARPPRPIHAADPATERLGAATTPAARRLRPADEQLTIPLERED